MGSIKLAILGAQNDPHVIGVLDHLDKFNVKPAIIDSTTLASSTLSISPSTLQVGDIILNDCDSIWNRRTFPTHFPEEMPKGWQKWSYKQYLDSLISLFLNSNAIWHNHPNNDNLASFKPYVLNLAQNATSFSVPPWMVTSNAEQAKEFIASLKPSEAIIKPVSFPVVDMGDRVLSIFTSQIPQKPEVEWEDLTYAPVIFQQKINRKAELRITYVNGRFFPVAIRIQKDFSHVDYRRVDPYSLKHEVISLPPEVERDLSELCEKLQLKYAAIDMLLDEKETLYFLEINPKGQWFWIEEITKAPISLEIAKLLAFQS